MGVVGGYEGLKPASQRTPGYTREFTYGPEGNPNFPGTVAYNKLNGVTTGTNTLQSYLDQMQKAAEAARVANIQRRNEIGGIYDQIASMYQPGGSFMQSGLADIERSKTRGVGQETQQMISSGLYGTTTQAGVGRRWEAEVGAPARTKLEDLATGRYGEALGQKAGFMERINEPYPDYGLMAQLAMQAANTPAAPTNIGTVRPNTGDAWMTRTGDAWR
jgi:hypothetical protein